MPANMFIYLTHGSKAIIKLLAKNLDKTLTAKNSQATIALAVTLRKEQNTETSLYYVESIQLHGDATPTPVSEKGFTLPAFVQYIESLKENHHVLNADMMLCCDGNLDAPGDPNVSLELWRPSKTGGSNSSKVLKNISRITFRTARHHDHGS